MKEGDGVPLIYTKKGDDTSDGHVVLYGSGSNTFYVAEEEVGSKPGLDGEGVVGLMCTHGLHDREE